MAHDTPLIATIAVGLAVAFALGLVAQRLRLPPIVGYLLAGVVVGPFTPGFVADQRLAVELAEIGVILLMFGVGLHFSLKDLLSVRAIAIPGAIGQIAVATALGAGLAWSLGWSLGAGLIFGLSLSVASTVVLLRALQERRQVETEKGKIAVGWLIVEDLVMVLTLVLVPPLAGLLGGTPPAASGSPELIAALGIGTVWTTLLVTAAKIAIFVALMLIVGRQLIPWVLHYVAHTGSRELFRLSVLSIALGVAFASAKLFGVSFALGAFFAGMVLAESQLSSQAAKETLPLRDAFAVLFFVSVGMLFDPATLLRQPLAVLATFLIITFGKSVAAYAIVRAFGHPNGVALTISASLAQIGEFSFILIVLAVGLAVIPPEARDLVVAGSILSILVNPLLFYAIDRLQVHETASPSPVPSAAAVAASTSTEDRSTRLSNHVVLAGYGRVGSTIGASLLAKSIPFLVVEEDSAAVAGLERKGVDVFVGAIGEQTMLDRLNLRQARYLISAIPDTFEAGHLVEVAKAANPNVRVIARAHSADEVDYLRKRGADVVLMGEEELAKGMSAEVLP
jgi:CPA2 family monovalent cation:H+ antiporter-2